MVPTGADNREIILRQFTVDRVFTDAVASTELTAARVHSSFPENQRAPKKGKLNNTDTSSGNYVGKA